MGDASTDPSDPVYARAPNVVWRLGPDRVLVRRVGGDGLDLLGPAALVWIALESPLTHSELASEVGEFSTDSVSLYAALRELVDRCIVQESP